jgi:heptosyltransferase II
MLANERILVVAQAWIGDIVMAQSLFMTLRARFPNCAIDVVGPGWSVPLLARMPEVREAIELSVDHGEFGWRARRALGRGLRSRDYGRAIVLPRSLKAALVPFLAGIPLRTGYLGEQRFILLNDIRRPDPAVTRETVKAFVALGLPPHARLPEQIPEPKLSVDPSNQSGLAARLGLDGAGPVVALAPGAAFGPAKRWPAEHFAAVARGLLASGRRMLILGSSGDVQTAREIAGAAPGVTDLCGRTSLEDAIDLLGLTSVLVTNDSGLMHVGAAVGCHVIAIYGSTSPDGTPPLTSRHDVQYRRLPCSPCHQKTCPLGHLDCLRGISPETVTAAVHRALDAQTARGSRGSNGTP